MIVAIIFLQIIIFGGIIFFVRHMLSQNVTSATSHLQDAVKEYAKKQEDMEKKLKESQEQYEATMKKAKKEAEILKDQTRKEIEEERNRIIEQAHRESEIIIERAQKSAEAIRADQEKLINEKAVEKSGNLVCQIIPQNIAEEMHKTWVEDLIRDGITGLERLRIPDEVKFADISTAFALPPEQHQEIKDTIKQKLNKDVELREEVNISLIAGMIIRLGNLILDGSFYGKIGELVHDTIIKDNE